MIRFDPQKEMPEGRCTSRDEYGNADINGVDMSFLLGLDYEQLCTMQQALNRLADFEDALEEPKWIPCSVKMPEDEDMYLVPDNRYLCQLEAYGQRKFCVCSRLKGAVGSFWDWYGIPFRDSEVVAWMPLPKAYEKGE